MADLPMTLGVDEVARVWGIHRNRVYANAKLDALPVAPLRVGRSLRWPTALVAASVGLDTTGLVTQLSR